MAYQTGTVTSTSDLASVITNFAVANGWTLNSGVLSKAGAYIRLQVISVSELRIDAARNGNFSTPDISPLYSRIFNTTWPSTATYHIVAFSNPDTVWCTINFDVIKFQHIGFGTIEKYGTWNGGQWFHAQHTQESGSKDGNVTSYIDGDVVPLNSMITTECALFWGGRMNDNVVTFRDNGPSKIQCDLRGNVWEPPPSTTGNQIYMPQIVTPIHKTNPNAFNGQTVLTPFTPFLKGGDGYFMPIGRIGHLRFVKLANYDPGDVITIGSDKWKVFPWYIKDTTKPDGERTPTSSATQSTGILGVAVRYDGP
jgi:hypothetical protein